MSRRAFGYFLSFLVLSGAFAWLFFTNFSIGGWNQLQIVRRSQPSHGLPAALKTTANKIIPSSFDPSSPRPKNHPSPVRTVQGSRYITVATFNMESFNQLKARKVAVMDVYARILSRFDVIALQEIQSDTDDILPRLTTKMNVRGQTYDYIIGPRTGPTGATEQFGFVFNLKTIEVDRNALYTVDDRDNLLMRDPLVGWFRCRGVPAEQAFTFSLANVHVDPNRVRDEIPVLRDVMFKIRDDGRGEDDVILLGDFGPQYRSLPDLDGISDLGWAVGEVSTLTAGEASVDNIAFQKTATPEFTGRTGVFDFLREFNLSMEQAIEVSDHLPVFASFSAFESGEAGRVASNTESSSR